MERRFAHLGWECKLVHTLLVCLGLLIVGLDDLHAQFSGLFVRTDGRNVTYFDLSQAAGVVEGFLFSTNIDSSDTEGLTRDKTEVKGRVERGEARLSSTFFLLAKQIGVAQSSPTGFTLRLSSDDGMLRELRFRRASAAQVNAAIQVLATQGRRARAAWAKRIQSQEAAARYAENRRQLPSDLEAIRGFESRLRELTAGEAEAQTALRTTKSHARGAHERARKARQAARTPDEQFAATDVEYAATSADYEVTSAEYQLGSIKYDLEVARTNLNEARTSAETRRQELIADSTWLVANGFRVP